jgi:dCTP deaminase
MPDAGVLTGPQICAEVENGAIVIDPWEPGKVIEDPERWDDHPQVNSASYDLSLGNKVAVYKNVTYFIQGGVHAHFYRTGKFLTDPSFDPTAYANVDKMLQRDPEGVLDTRKKNDVWEFTIDPERGWLLRPGIGYLMHTHERVLTDRYVPIIDGKSSIGRLFVTAHVTAGYGDAGFNGQYTLEVLATYPTIVYPGMRFCQMRFMTHVGRPRDYKTKGHYVGAASMGPVPSMSWKQFEEQQKETRSAI